MGVLTGCTDRYLDDEQRMSPATVQPVQFNRTAQDVLGFVAHELIATETVTVGTSTYLISSGSSAKVGSVLYFTSGSLLGAYFSVIEVNATIYTLGQTTSIVPAPGDSFEVLRYKQLRLNSSGELVIASSPTTLSYAKTRPSIPSSSSTQVIAANTSRKEVVVINNNVDTPVMFHLEIGAAAVTNQCLRLRPGEERIFKTTQAINAIQSSGGPLNLEVYEGT